MSEKNTDSRIVGDGRLHGTDGPMIVSTIHDPNPVAEATVKAATLFGFREIDINGIHF